MLDKISVGTIWEGQSTGRIVRVQSSSAGCVEVRVLRYRNGNTPGGSEVWHEHTSSFTANWKQILEF